MYFDILSEKQKEVFKQLETFDRGGYLAGGTSLVLQLAHRKSYDFDLFLPKPLSTRFRFNAKQHFKKFTILVDTSDEFSFVSSLDVKISFIFYPFKNLFKLLSIRALPLADWRDVALDKAHTIGRRGEWRDYVDLYFILKNGFSIEEIAEGAERKFGDLFSRKLFLSQLCYLGDVQDAVIDFTDEKIQPDALQKFFEEEVVRAKKVLGL